MHTLFGIPLGRLGWFASALIGLALGLIAFGLATFVGIASILVYSSATHRAGDYALSYRWGGLAAGVFTLIAAWSYLGLQWARRILRKA